MHFFDAHCHLQDSRYAGNSDEIIRRALLAGTDRMVCCSAFYSDWDEVYAIAQRNDSVIPFFGIHPLNTGTALADWPELLYSQLRSVPSGVGETGLDFTLKETDRTVQETFFRQHLRIANELNLPVEIHCRNAWGRLVAIIKEEGLKGAGMIHSCSCSSDMVPELEKLGLYLSFSGSLTRKNNRKAHECVAEVSENRLLIETDSPDMLPQNVHAALNEPFFIGYIAKAAAELRHTSIEKLSGITYTNTVSLMSGLI